MSLRNSTRHARELEDEEKIRRGELHGLNFIDQQVRHEQLMPLRDGLQGLQKKGNKLEETQPDIWREIGKKDLPELIEKLRGATAEKDVADASEEIPADQAE